MANTKRGKTAEQTYRDHLLMALRLQEVPGDRIGDVLAEVEAHTAETGEDPLEAFGPAKAYAREIAVASGLPVRRPWSLDRRTLLVSLGIGVLSFLSASLLAGGVTTFVGTGENTVGLPPTAALVLGVVGAIATIALVTFSTRHRTDPVRDPRTGTVERFPRWILPVTFAGLFAAFTAMAALIASME